MVINYYIPYHRHDHQGKQDSQKYTKDTEPNIDQGKSCCIGYQSFNDSQRFGPALLVKAIKN